MPLFQNNRLLIASSLLLPLLSRAPFSGQPDRPMYKTPLHFSEKPQDSLKCEKSP